MKKNPAIKLQVTGGGSGTGLSSLINGTTDIATSSRPIKPAENEKLVAKNKAPATELPVAKDGVTFYVNEKNPLTSLTTDQLKKIYMGDITNWKEVGGPDAPIALYSRENSSGTYVFVKDDLLGGGDYAATAQTLPGTAAVVNAVSKEKFGIGYGGAAYAKGVKELKIKSGAEEIEATEANVKSGKYPLSRSLFFYLRAAPTGEAKTFIDYCLSKEGQEIVTKVGYFPLH
jgi:phosphate transport system substrate-binding protein